MTGFRVSHVNPVKMALLRFHIFSETTGMHSSGFSLSLKFIFERRKAK